MQNGLQLNPDKSEALIIGTTAQLHAVASAVSSVAIASVKLPVAEEMKVLGVVLDRHLTFEKHVTMVARSCHYHAQAIRHIRHLLSTELASTLARSLILTRLDYCNSLLHGSHTSSIQTLQRVHNNAARIVLQAPMQCHTNPVRHRIKYKLAVMTYKIHSTGLLAYINPRETARTLHSSDTLLFTVPFTKTELAKRAFGAQLHLSGTHYLHSSSIAAL